MHDARYPVGQRTGQIAQAVHELRSQSLRGQGIDHVVRQLLHIDVGEDLGGDSVGERGLDTPSWIAGLTVATNRSVSAT
jgi:hypothetical protein